MQMLGRELGDSERIGRTYNTIGEIDGEDDERGEERDIGEEGDR